MLAALRARAFVAECVGPLELNAAVQCCCATVRSKQAPLSARALRLARVGIETGNKGTENGNKGTENGNKGTENGNKGTDTMGTGTGK
jgi:hypothetical protein